MPARKRTSHLRLMSEVESFAAGLDQSHLLCRELGHLWSPWTAGLTDGGGYVRILRCPRCLTERHQVLDGRAHVVSNVYRYPDGYQHKGLGRIVGEGRDMLRLESITRTLDNSGRAVTA